MSQDGVRPKKCDQAATAKRVSAAAVAATAAMVCTSPSTAQIAPAPVVQSQHHDRGHRRGISRLLNGEARRMRRDELNGEIQRLLADSALNVRECMVALKVLGQRKLWQEAVGLMKSMSFRRLEPDQFVFNKIISICASSKEGLPAWDLLRTMRQRRLFPDVYACNMVIGALATGGSWEKALSVIDSMKRCQTIPDVVTMNSAIAACAQSSRWMEAIQLLDEGQQLPSGPDVMTYGATMHACEAKWRLVLHLLDEMQNKKIQPNEMISASVMGACAKGSPEKSTDLFTSLKEQGIRQNKVSYTAALSACHKDQYLWEWSLWYLQEMKTTGVEIDIGIMNGIMAVCEKAHQWGQLQKRNTKIVEQLLDDIKYLELTPDIITYSHTMAAAKQVGAWQRVLGLLNQACIQKLQPDGVLYTHAISACANGSRWEHALTLLAAANAVGSLEFHWSSAMTACAQATQWEHAISLASQMLQVGLQPEIVTKTALMCAYVHGGHWPVALELLSMMLDSGEEPNHITLTSVIRACMQRGDFAFAVKWKVEMEALGVQPYLTTYVFLIALAAEAQEWKWVQYLLAESFARYPQADNFDVRQLYNLVLLKCLKFGNAPRAIAFWKDYLDSGVSSTNAMLAACEDLDWSEFKDLCEELGPASWVQGAKEAALSAELALARGWYTGHGSGWQQDALGQVAMTLDLLSWHGISAAELKNKFAHGVFDFVLAAVIADTDTTVLHRASTGRTHTRLRQPILKGPQLQNVMLSSDFTKQALQSLELAASETWLTTGRLRARRELPAKEEAGDGLDNPARGLRARWISFRPSKKCAEGHENRGTVVLGADAGCKEWLAPHALDKAFTRFPQEHRQLLRDIMKVAGTHGSVRMYMSYAPCLACLATLFQLRTAGLRCEVAFDTWRETRSWTC